MKVILIYFMLGNISASGRYPYNIISLQKISLQHYILTDDIPTTLYPYNMASLRIISRWFISLQYGIPKDDIPPGHFTTITKMNIIPIIQKIVCVHTP